MLVLLWELKGKSVLDKGRDGTKMYKCINYFGASSQILGTKKGRGGKKCTSDQSGYPSSPQGLNPDQRSSSLHLLNFPPSFH